MYSYFDVSELAQQAGVSSDQLRELEGYVRRQYGSDEMLFELRMLRTLRAICDRVVSIDQAIAEFRVCHPTPPAPKPP